jgi:WD40 repeat protein
MESPRPQCTRLLTHGRSPHLGSSSLSIRSSFPHSNPHLTWNEQKGSLPTARIRAHNAKIYGIDWAHARAHDIVTCSLDKTIKVWNVQDASASEPPRCQSYSKTIAKQQPQPLTTIMTRYPVWRARDLPFGRGILSLPQRGETALEMWAEGNNTVPVEVFEGHTDVVKEFVWRKGGLGECTVYLSPFLRECYRTFGGSMLTYFVRLQKEGSINL